MRVLKIERIPDSYQYMVTYRCRESILWRILGLGPRIRRAKTEGQTGFNYYYPKGNRIPPGSTLDSVIDRSKLWYTIE
jgi:hypothetical protein